MSATIEQSGDIDIYCFPSGSPINNHVPIFPSVGVGDRLALVFAADGANAPYALKIVSPSGSTILESIVRELPTSTPQSPPPIEFVISARGLYKVEIREMRGRQRGEASVRIA